MTSYRKKQTPQLESPDSPVTTAPTEAAKPPEPVADPKPLPEIETEAPVERAARSAIRDRLAEMERAEQLARQGAQQPPPQQPQAEQPEMPAHVREWLERR